MREVFGHFGDLPYVGDLLRRTDLLLIETHFALNYQRPISRNILEIGGVGSQRAQPLPKVGLMFDLIYVSSIQQKFYRNISLFFLTVTSLFIWLVNNIIVYISQPNDNDKLKHIFLLIKNIISFLLTCNIVHI